MSNRRVPLASLQNATNSPLRATALGGKRQRSHASEQRDLPYGQPPPKKQIVEVDDAEARRNGLGRRTGAPTAFQKKLEAARDVKGAGKQSSQRALSENLETIRQWQKHYRKMFPTFVFFFESIPDDVKSKVYRQVATLGAREVKIFTKEVTHVITTRPIPPEMNTSSSNAKGTINPAQLDTKRSVFDAALQKTGGNGDILYKARELGMKIWSAEKLQRMLRTMFETDTGEQPVEYTTRYALSQAKASRQADLGKLLQDERLKGHLDYSVASQDMVQLRGYYIYIHDMDEMTKPVMIREYPKVAKKEDGKWPQFRVSGIGKCPFVLDPHHIRKQQEQHQEEQRARAAKAAAPRTRAAAAMEERRGLGDNSIIARRTVSTTDQAAKEDEAKPLDPPKAIPPKRANTDGMPPMFGSAQASIRPVSRIVGGEPVASGIMPSNVTSAIRSQMISSTAAAPGARAGNTKEVNQLKRKVLEKNGPAAKADQAVLDDARAVLNGEYAQPPRAAKRKAQDALELIKEEATQVEEQRRMRKTAAMRRRRTTEKELKPGYCENCGEKFNDFDEHIVSRKHRKFAMTKDNWTELDQLLAQLVRH